MYCGYYEETITNFYQRLMNKFSRWSQKNNFPSGLKQKVVLLIIAVLVVVAFSAWRHTGQVEEGTVTKVVDGDTIILDDGNTVRYIGIDTPEVSVPVTPMECFGSVATEKNRELVENRKVKLVRDIKNKDKYGRLLRYVYADDVLVNLELVQGGYARVLTVYPNVSYSREIEIAEHRAQDSQKGLWSAEECNGGK